MKVVYCLTDSSLPGGMERSICCKANYLADQVGYDVTIITTDRGNKSNFYEFSPKIKFIDLGIMYSDLEKMPLFSKLRNQTKKMRVHREKLKKALIQLNPDIIISTYTNELSIIPQIKSKSKKIVEVHFSKCYKEIEYSKYSKLSPQRLFALIADKRKQWFVRKYDALVVLTRADKELWRGNSCVEVIPNVVSFYPVQKSDGESNRFISVGRLTYVKGYDLLLSAWSKIAHNYPDWKLDIYGDGEDLDFLVKEIARHRLENSVYIHSALNNIEEEYLDSSVYIMSSLVEGFGIVLTEAMACGLPCISFDCPTGPSEIITNGEDGLLIPYKDVNKLAEAISFLIQDKMLRKEMGENAKVNVQRFLPERIMPRWISIFEKLTGTSAY